MRALVIGTRNGNTRGFLESQLVTDKRQETAKIFILETWGTNRRLLHRLKIKQYFTFLFLRPVQREVKIQ